MDLDELERAEVHNLIKSLNSKKDSIIVVEGKRDREALEKLGFTGNTCQFHSFQGLMKFVDYVMQYNSLVVLLDSDRKGAYLTRRIISQLGHRMTVDLSFRRKLTTITRGKARHVEDLLSYYGAI